MQTKPKQKLTAILIALTMILTTMMQLCIPITVHAEETNREIDFNYSAYGSYIYQSQNHEKEYIFNCHVVGSGNYVIKSYRIDTENAYGSDYQMLSYIVSNKPFQYYCSGTNQNGGGSDNLLNPYTYNGYYFVEQQFQFSSIKNVRYTDITLNGYFGSIKDVDSFIYSPQFGNLKEDIDNGNIDLSKDDFEEKTFDEVATYDENIPTPKFKVEKNLRFEFLNNESDYYYEIKGRWYTTDDFYLHLGGFMNAIWLYDYDTIYKNDLTEWITYKDKRNTAITGYLKDIGEKSFNDLITKYPIGTRQITGEKNKDGSYKVGFDHASSNLVMWLKDATSIYNGIEVYIRYYKVDDSGNYTYGKWAHYYNGLAKQSGAEVNDNVLNDVEHNYSDKGLTNDELTDLENSGQSKGDTDIITDYGDNGGGILTEIDKLDEIDFSNVVKVILSLFQQTKSIFNMFTTVISFMPNWVTELIGVSVVIICLIGIWKALR